MKLRWLVIPAVLLFLAGCEDSKNPLSDPTTSKPDERLIGVWWDGSEYYHIGHAGKRFPKGVLRVVAVAQSEGDVEPPAEYLAFPTVLDDKTYLNVVSVEKQVKRLDSEGWKTEAVECYTIFKYQLDGDKLVVWMIDAKAMEQAIKSGKIKGVIEKDLPKFTDITENVARFVAEAGDGLWDNEAPMRFERLETAKKQMIDGSRETATRVSSGPISAGDAIP
jgi:hypothetical protein